MNKIPRTMLAALLLAASAAGLRAQQYPDTGVLRLPEISTAAASQIAACDLTVIIVDEKDKMVTTFRNQMRWKAGVWKTMQGNAMVQMLFPLKFAERMDASKLRYKMEYQISPSDANKPLLKIVEYLPLSGAEPFTAEALFPLDTVTIDAGGLKYEDSALKSAKVSLDVRVEGRAKKYTVAFGLKTAQTAILFIDRGSKASSQVSFACNYKGKMMQLPGDHNNKELSALPSGLSLRLAQPDCPQ